eukprot:SAG31_NODE_33583_length_342_cov_0.794239_1_plen_70_part_01
MEDKNGADCESNSFELSERLSKLLWDPAQAILRLAATITSASHRNPDIGTESDWAIFESSDDCEWEDEFA